MDLSRDITGKFPQANQKAPTILLVSCHANPSKSCTKLHKYTRITSYDSLYERMETRFNATNVKNSYNLQNSTRYEGVDSSTKIHR